MISDNVTYAPDSITAHYVYDHTVVDTASDGTVTVTPQDYSFEFRVRHWSLSCLCLQMI